MINRIVLSEKILKKEQNKSQKLNLCNKMLLQGAPNSY